MLLGKDGQVGWQLQRSLAPLGRVMALGRGECDLADADALLRTVRALRPAIIVNAAAYTAVDQAEREPELAQRINATAPGILADEARSLGALLVHYSTDYVFDGSKAAPWVESDTPNPLSVYGQSKHDGERAIAASGARALIFRTSWVFGARGKNFVKTVLRLAGEGRPLRIVDDQIGSPTPAAMISTVTGLVLAALRRGERAPDGCTLYHLAATNPVSWCGFARAILDVAARTPGFDGLPAAGTVTPITTADYPLPATRPANSRLDCAQLERDFALEMPDWLPYLERMMQLLALKRANGY
nr:dTDP-4-dehydrorhamnose reductase [Rhodocyclus gracilis]